MTMECRVAQGCLASLTLVCVFSLGCAGGPSAQVTSCQAEKKELLAAIEQERAASKGVKERAAALEARLDQSEKEIARLTGRRSAWDSDSPRSASTRNSTDKAPATKTSSSNKSPAETLPWRPHRDNAPVEEPKPKKPANAATKPKVSAQAKVGLSALAQRDSRLEYDPATNTAKFNVDVAFDAGGAALTAEGRKELDELARWLQSEQTRELRVLVAGSSSSAKKPQPGEDGARFASARQLGAARAMSVADYLDRHGIQESRLAITGSGARISGGEEVSPGQDTVQIYVAEADSPMLGFAPPRPNLRR